MSDRLRPQLDFLIEADKLKSVTRANVLSDGSRHENFAEHSWHLCLWALVFADEDNGANLPRVIQMLLVHDLCQIEPAGIFDRLPADQAINYRLLAEEFEDGKTMDAAYAQNIDKAAPMFLELYNPLLTQTERDLLRANLQTGRFADLHDDWPDLYQHADNLLNRRRLAPLEPLASRLRFLMEADRLKSVERATTLCDGSRRENSAEHSWHIMLWALTLAEHSATAARIDVVLLMLLLHDIVEIDAGDTPIHGAHDVAAIQAKEQAAADRLYGLLPPVQRDALRGIWDTFEAARTDDAIYAKSLDRAQPLVCNLQSGGGSWIEYNVTRDQIETRIGAKVNRGAPALWSHLSGQIDAWYAQNSTSA